MDQLKSLGRRDIFGILLPGTIPIFVGAYLLWGLFKIFDVPVGNILEQEFLVTVILFVTAYFVGSLLRLFAADNVDKKSSDYLLRAWKKENQETVPPEYEEMKNALSKGELVEEMPSTFDVWLWATDTFPYVAWQNRFWQTNGFSDVINFYKQKHKGSLWSEHNSSPKSFFNYCKLVIAESGGTLAEETYTAEGLTRFFAGTYSALRVSIVMLTISLIIQLLLSVKWLITLIGSPSNNSDISSIQIIISVLFILILLWMQKLIVKKFRRIRLKEAETVFYAFFLINQKQDK